MVFFRLWAVDHWEGDQDGFGEQIRRTVQVLLFSALQVVREALNY